ncbi:MAG: hypothetical protein COC10_07495 [Sphingobium sp.]|jgi:hypothetical protein|nr:MAG: hypothetical protein COC10_07495 [Sphingobium sp.]
MLPRLHAQEQLQRIEASRIAGGAYEQHDSRALVEQLRAAARGDAAVQPAKRASHGQMGAMGIGIRLVPVEAQNDG